MVITSHSAEVSDRNEEHVIGNQRKGDPCCKVVKNLAELCSTVFSDSRNTSDKTGCLAEDIISRQSVEGVAWLFLTAFSKVRGERGIEQGVVKKKVTRT